MLIRVRILPHNPLRPGSGDAVVTAVMLIRVRALLATQVTAIQASSCSSRLMGARCCCCYCGDGGGGDANRDDGGDDDGGGNGGGDDDGGGGDDGNSIVRTKV